MHLHLFEKFILIALDQKKGRFLIDSLSLNYGIAGAILLELSELNKIILQNKRLIVKDIKLTNIIILDTCIKLINSSKKNHGAKYWISKIGNKSSVFKKIILTDLVNGNILRIEKKAVIFGLFNLSRYTVINAKLIDEIKLKLSRIVFDNEKPDTEGMLLLSLMSSCKLIRILFLNRKEYKTAKKRIKELVKDIEINEDVSHTLKEIQSAVVAATVTTYIG